VAERTATAERPRRPRLVLADDQVLLLEALAKLLEPEFEVVRCVTDGRALVQAATDLCPEAVVLDLSMARTGGLDAARRIRQRRPGIKMVCITAHDDGALAAEASRAGVSAFVPKSVASAELVRAIRLSLAGGSYRSPTRARPHAGRHSRAVSAPAPATGPLTPREQEVLRLIAQGSTMKEAGAALGITARTVAFHKYRVMRSFCLHSTAEFVRFAIERKLV
jgi:DNA-binding NarL/FixJ family response regulator